MNKMNILLDDYLVFSAKYDSLVLMFQGYKIFVFLNPSKTEQ